MAEIRNRIGAHLFNSPVAFSGEMWYTTHGMGVVVSSHSGRCSSASPTDFVAYPAARLRSIFFLPNALTFCGGVCFCKQAEHLFALHYSSILRWRCQYPTCQIRIPSPPAKQSHTILPYLYSSGATIFARLFIAIACSSLAGNAYESL